MADHLHHCMTKATTAVGDQRRHGPNWLTSRRGMLTVFADHLECGNWRIDYSDITDAVLFSFRSTLLRIPGCILTIATPDRTYHFGLNGWGRFWEGELPFRVRREQGKIGYTWFSIAVRLTLVVCLGYELLKWIATR